MCLDFFMATDVTGTEPTSLQTNKVSALLTTNYRRSGTN